MTGLVPIACNRSETSKTHLQPIVPLMHFKTLATQGPWGMPFSNQVVTELTRSANPAGPDVPCPDYKAPFCSNRSIERGSTLVTGTLLMKMGRNSRQFGHGRHPFNFDPICDEVSRSVRQPVHDLNFRQQVEGSSPSRIATELH